MNKLITLTIIVALALSANAQYKYANNRAAARVLSAGYGQQSQIQTFPPIPKAPVQYNQQIMRPTVLPTQPQVFPQQPQVFPQQPQVFPQQPQVFPQQQQYGQVEPPKQTPPTVILPPAQEESYNQVDIQKPQIELPPVQPQQQYQSYGQQMTSPIREPAPAPKQNPCIGANPGDKLPVEFDTNKFIYCLEEGKWETISCGQFLVFNPNTDKCEYSLKTPKGCSSSPCLNNGKCIDLPFFQYKCECQVGYTGDLCEKIDVCSNMPCGPSGTCVTLPTGAPLDKYCLCNGLSSFGIDCIKSVEVNPCLTNVADLKTFPTQANSAVYVQCEGNFPHLRFCNYPLVYSHEFQGCDWTATSTIEVVPKMVPQTSYSSYGQQIIDRPLQKITQTQSGY